MTTTTSSAENGGGGGATVASSPSPPNLPLQLPSAAGHQRLGNPGHPPVSPPSVPITTGTTQIQLPRPTLLMDVAIRCTSSNCSCDCFSPCKTRIRMCDGCGHGWVSHALDKLGYRHLYNCHQVEVVQPSIAFDVASLLLYGTQAIPVRLKILLDRLFSVLQREEVLQVLHGFGWTYEDYARGYIIQDPSGAILDRWLLASKEEEPLIFQQFLRFGETKSIAQQLLLQEGSEKLDCVVTPSTTDSDIKKFIERTNNRSHVGSSLFKQHGSHIYNPLVYSLPPLGVPLGAGKPIYRHASSSVSSTQSNISSTVSSPIDCTSPIALSPLNKLQNMQPYDFRRDSPELAKGDSSDKHASQTVPSYAVSNSPSSVPNTCFTTSSLTNVSSTNNSSLYTTATSDRSGNEDDVDFSEDEGDGANGAINLTRHSSSNASYRDSVYAARKVRHLRKSANPMKRKWNPNVLATLAMNPTTGKKRVQCHVCFKTFCDKGALKIHFSAVHLREMHKCTVEGCNMMFSSRRSRNRHSANPNPKLHTPNSRRKINPHDGRAANPFPLANNSLLDYPNGFIPYSSGQNDCESNSVSEDDQKTMVPGMNSVFEHKIDMPPLLKKQERLPDLNDVPLSLTKKCHTEDAVELKSVSNEGMDLSVKEPCKKILESLPIETQETLHTNIVEKSILLNSYIDDKIKFIETKVDEKESNKDGNCESEEKPEYKSHSDQNIDEKSLPNKSSHTSEETLRNEENKDNDIDNVPTKKLKYFNVTDPSKLSDKSLLPISSTKGVRKRKSLNPIRCPTTSDDDLPFVSSDDSSSDTYIDQDNDENGLLDSKSDFYSSDGSDSMDDLEEVDGDRNNKNVAINSNKSLMPSTSEASTMAQTSRVDDKRQHEKYNGFLSSELNHIKSPDKMKEDISKNPLKHLESLSLGSFSNIMNANSKINFNHRNISISSGVSYHAPGLGLASVTTTTAPNRAESPNLDMVPSLSSKSVSHLPPPPVSYNCNLNNSDTDNSMSENQLSHLPVYRDASMISSVDIPVDKENPRRCTACGKIFQNHFGVKTHYQNVHLKLMHKCTVEGCNAAFPSKRSRDRHSSNMNLHRKLLSTSSDRTGGMYFDKSNSLYSFHPDSYSRDIFPSFHEQSPIPLAAMEFYSRMPHDGTGAFLSPYAHLPGALPNYHPAFFSPSAYTTFKNDTNTRYNNRHGENSGQNSSSSSISNRSSPGPSSRGSPKINSGHFPAVKLDEELSADHDGRFVCTICEKKFHEGVVLREHYEKSHTQDLIHCSTNGCNKVFLSKQSRKIHSDNLHKEEKVNIR